MKLKTLAILPLLFGANVMAADNATTLDTDKQKISYIFGIQVGQNMMQEGVELDIEAFKAGVADMMAGQQPQLDQATAEQVVQAYQAQKAQELAKVMNEKQAQAKAFMEENAKKDGVVTTDSGLQYEVLKEGDGATPTENDKVIANYKGTLIDGTVFDSSYDRGEPATFPVNGVIQGWQEALKMMKEGSKWRIVVPANLAYGPRGAGNLIGPNETLIFEIELIAITK
ncbi:MULTISPECIES: FKBP-type peptidyl-prolyl cis-trans isomerase [unclassified Methylophaga]|jgi:FKBP-type peptidyl-prolyl cis-trans isomerase FklB|uniref:FKBP-type peptidyl-prolyl cis-trans isomerase n=1 Tax=unclassified Methylophaga TaxID=2629249 RepID=UPI0023B5C389|nr:MULTISPECIES: FKBP-type peptidyl-prolyl cis-trans isomerase [unclassified Methylophaga]|tara:strand:+ start:6574 stop:7254 length:681 start_codon:yes stop_codon:yes gene_type:complete